MNPFKQGTKIHVEDPPIARFLFSDTRAGLIWLVLRVWLGFRWLQPGLGKLQNPNWMNGNAIGGFWENAVDSTAVGWYGTFLQTLIDANANTWFGPLIAITETAIGVLLIVGAFTGIAALAGGFMNWNFIMAGTASSNALMGLGAVLLVVAWKVAGWYGLDRWLLPRLGTPWSPQVKLKTPQLQGQEPLPDSSSS